MKKFALAFAGISVLALAGCVSQEQADEKMKTGCKAAVETMIAPRTIKEVKVSSAEAEKTMGSVYRRIKLTYVENDDFADSEHEGSCLFSEQWGAFKSTHAALLEQVVFNDELVGKKDGVINGSMNDFLKLSEHVDTAMGQ
jgi:hypothetical protein